MGEIKSSIEIAMERAAAMEGSDEEELLQAEAEKKGKILARRLLGGDLTLEGLGRELAELEERALPFARRSAARVLLEGMADNPQASLLGIRDLAQAAGAQAEALAVLSAAEAIHSAAAGLEEELAREMARDLAREGISGSALAPNPQAHPQYDQRMESALAQASQELARAGDRLLDALGG